MSYVTGPRFNLLIILNIFRKQCICFLSIIGWQCNDVY